MPLQPRLRRPHVDALVAHVARDVKGNPPRKRRGGGVATMFLQQGNHFGKRVCSLRHVLRVHLTAQQVPVRKFQQGSSGRMAKVRRGVGGGQRSGQRGVLEKMVQSVDPRIDRCGGMKGAQTSNGAAKALVHQGRVVVQDGGHVFDHGGGEVACVGVVFHFWVGGRRPQHPVGRQQDEHRWVEGGHGGRGVQQGRGNVDGTVHECRVQRGVVVVVAQVDGSGAQLDQGLGCCNILGIAVPTKEVVGSFGGNEMEVGLLVCRVLKNSNICPIQRTYVVVEDC